MRLLRWLGLQRRVALTTLTALMALSAFAGTATAATRYAAPAGVGTAPCTAQGVPCPVGTALEAAVAGDDVELAPGEYTPEPPPFGPAVEVPDGVLLHGESRTARSVIRADESLVVRLLGEASAADLDIYSSDLGGSRGALSIDTGTADRVRAYASWNYGCFIFAGTIRNSVCSSSDPAGEGLLMSSAVDANAVIAGSTIYGAGSGMRLVAFLASPTLLATMINSIVRGEKDGIVLQANEPGANANAQFRNSSYDPLDVVHVGEGSTNVFDLGDNQSEPPLLANPAAGDFRQLPGSPTIDAGLPGAAASDPFDVLGAVRTQNGIPDIGAHESTPPPRSSSTSPTPSRPTPTCRGKAATIVGTPGSDNIVGTAKRDVVVALNGPDQIRTFAGNDLICAGAGPDVVRSGGGNDAVLGQGGNDFVRGGAGRDFLFGHRGNDRMSGDAGPDRLFGGAGADILKGHAGRDRILGGSWGDILKGGAGPDILRGGNGSDLLAGNRGRPDVCDGQAGRDRLATPGCERRLRIP